MRGADMVLTPVAATMAHVGMHRPAADAVALCHGTDEATVAELEAARKRVAELESRVAALEAQAAAQGTARGALTDQLADLTTAQQVRCWAPPQQPLAQSDIPRLLSKHLASGA